MKKPIVYLSASTPSGNKKEWAYALSIGGDGHPDAHLVSHILYRHRKSAIRGGLRIAKRMGLRVKVA